MGVTLQQLTGLADQSVLVKSCAVLDIGTSNLYKASTEQTAEFLTRFGATADPAFCQKIADGSAFDPVKGGLNESWVGELLETAGFEYVSFDVAQGYKTTLFDLNRERLPRKYKSAFDAVMNFGTTEHVFNQLHAMRIIHEAAKPGGHIVHQVPCSGFTDHGYFVYTPRFFFDVAGYNNYSIVEMSFSGGGHDSVFRGAREYKPVDNPTAQSANYCITVVLKKQSDEPFRVPLETSTSVGTVAGMVSDTVDAFRSLIDRITGR